MYKELNSTSVVGVVGAGTMGAGIAQVAAASGHSVLLLDAREGMASAAIARISDSLQKLVVKGKMQQDQARSIVSRLGAVKNVAEMAPASLVIEAIVEDLQVKRKLFSDLSDACGADTVLATNTSSLSVTAIAGGVSQPGRVIGLHFFNPAPLMPLVEVVPALQTYSGLADACVRLMNNWKKVPVVAGDTPGFIVNRVARPFYGEALRICEEGIADMATIDESMRRIGNFRMGPFELMDLIGNDVNYAVTETVWSQLYFDPRYRPSLIQRKMTESGRLGRKSGHGYYDYSEGAVQPLPSSDQPLQQNVFERILAMLINEAADAVYLKVANATEVDLAMTKGVNYPKGLLVWADEWGSKEVIRILDDLFDRYHDSRYRTSVLLRDMNARNQRFFS
jgi:3-hydroxybutyryl-CoA dehydrogenase